MSQANKLIMPDGTEVSLGGGASVRYDETNNSLIINNNGEGGSGDSGGSSLYDLYDITLTEDATRIDVFSGKEYKKIEVYIIVKAETTEQMIFYPCGKYCQGVGNVPNSYYGAEIFDAVIFDNAVNGTNLITYCNGFANSFSAPVSVNVEKTVIDQFYITMKTSTNVIKSGTHVMVFGYKGGE